MAQVGVSHVGCENGYRQKQVQETFRDPMILTANPQGIIHEVIAQHLPPHSLRPACAVVAQHSCHARGECTHIHVELHLPEHAKPTHMGPCHTPWQLSWGGRSRSMMLETRSGCHPQKGVGGRDRGHVSLKNIRVYGVGTPGIRNSRNSICIAQFQCSYSLQLLLGNHNTFLPCSSMNLPLHSF